jgi:hypothetical protein
MPSDHARDEPETDLKGFIDEYNGLTVDESAPCRGGIHCEGSGRVSIDDTLDGAFDCEWCRLSDGFE